MTADAICPWMQFTPHELPAGAAMVPARDAAMTMQALSLAIADRWGKMPMSLDNIRKFSALTETLLKVQALEDVVVIDTSEEATQDNRVAREGEWLVWRPDREIGNQLPYKEKRFIRARPAKRHEPDGKEWAIVEWDSGHGSPSTFFESALSFSMVLPVENS